jgi:SAM-dependent methyltransferase
VDPSISRYDLATRDKVPLITKLMAARGPGLALDIGTGTGYTTRGVFGDRQAVCVDLDPRNLSAFRERLRQVPRARLPLCVVASATALPFRTGVFGFALLSEVLEHLEDEGGAVAELGRVLSRGGRGVITVPYTGLGFTSFLEWLRVRTVREYPGPEFHVRPGYDEATLGALLARHGLEIERVGFFLKVFAPLATDVVSLAHLSYQRLVHRRRAWTWADVVADESTWAARLYARIFPLLWGFSRLDRLLPQARGFGLAVAFRHRAGAASGPPPRGDP